MQTAGYVAIGLFVAGLVVALARWFVVRLIARWDEVQAAVMQLQKVSILEAAADRLKADVSGIYRKLESFVPRSEVDMKVGSVLDKIDQQRREGMERENRILEAISEANKQQQADNRETRTSITGVHSRIDRLIEKRNRDPGMGD